MGSRSLLFAALLELERCNARQKERRLQVDYHVGFKLEVRGHVDAVVHSGSTPQVVELHMAHRDACRTQQLDGVTVGELHGRRGGL